MDTIASISAAVRAVPTGFFGFVTCSKTTISEADLQIKHADDYHNLEEHIQSPSTSGPEMQLTTTRSTPYNMSN